MSKKVKLVLSGSGVLYPCFAGAIIRLAELGYEFEEVAGVSGGSIVAAALASGYKPNNELIQLIKDSLPGKNKAIDISVISLFSNWGLIKGDKIEKMLDKYMVKTFADTKIPLSVVTTDLSRKAERVFSTKKDPLMAISKVVRASMSIPFVFSPVNWGGEYYVDGGWVSNFPLDIFGNIEDVIGIRFQSTSHSFNLIKGIKDYIMNLIDTSIAANMDEDIEDAWEAKTITVKTSQGHLNFNITDKDVDQMVLDGKNAVDLWVKNQK